MSNMEFLLEFNVPTATKLDDLRINMLDFLRVTSYLNNRESGLLYPKSCLEICENTTAFQIMNEEGDITSKASVSLEHLRAYALIALTEFKRTFPRSNSKACPNIWVNGYGRIVRVESFENQ